MKKYLVVLIFITSLVINISGKISFVDPVVNKITCFAGQDDKLFAGTDVGVFLSIDSGVTWKLFSPSMSNIQVTSMTVVQTTLYVGTTAGCYYTAINGGPWLSLFPDDSPDDAVLSIYAIDSIVFVSSQGPPSLRARNNNSGQILWANNYGGGIGMVTSNKWIVQTSTGAARLSMDRGNSWSPIDSGIPKYVTILSICEDRGAFMAGTNSYGLFILDSGAYTWRRVNDNTLETSNIITLYQTNRTIIMVTQHNVFVSQDQGKTWKKTLLVTGILSVFAVNDRIYLGGYGGELYYSKDHGLTWTPLSGLSQSSWLCVGNPTSYSAMSCIAYSGNNYVVLGAGGGIFTSRDLTFWNIITDRFYQISASFPLDFRSVVWDGNQFVAVGNEAIITSPEGISWTYQDTGTCLNKVIWTGTKLYAVGCDANNGSGVIFISSDGKQWTKIYPDSVQETSLISILWTGSELIIMDRHGNIFVSEDGINWRKRSEVHSLFLGISLSWGNGKLLAIGWSNDLFLSADTGHTWIDKSIHGSSIPMACAWSGKEFLITGDGDTGYTSPDGDIWTPVKLSCDGATMEQNGLIWDGSRFIAVGWGIQFSPIYNGIETRKPIADDSMFHGIHISPNPFNPVTRIEYTLPAANIGSLKIFDISGRTVSVIANGRLSKGVHSTTWDAENRPAGVYIARLQAGTYSATQKVVLVK